MAPSKYISLFHQLLYLEGQYAALRVEVLIYAGPDHNIDF